MVVTSNLSYAYDGENQFHFPNISLNNDEHLIILGSSGIGKTTLLHLLSGLLKPKDGEIIIGNTPIHKLSRRDMDKFRGESLGIVFQQYHFIKSLTVKENLLLRQSFPNKINDIKRLNAIVDRLGLTDHLNKNVLSLSQGQQQRLAIALGIIRKPKVIFADEPTSNLDDFNCNIVIDLLKEEAKICKSNLIIITHDQRVKSHFKNQVIL